MAIVRRLLEEGFGKGSINWLAHQVSPDYVGHLGNGDHYGSEGLRIDINGYRSMIANMTVTIEDLFACCDRVTRRFTFRGIARGPFVGQVTRGTTIVMNGIAVDRLHDGMMVESWVLMAPMSEEPEPIG